MIRIYEPAAYGPQGRCWWADTVAGDHWPSIDGDMTADVAVIGGGYTGLSAALHLAEGGASVALLEAEHPGWGASGRNGGFCCLGGAKASDTALRKRFGADGLARWKTTKIDAIRTVEALIDRFGIQVDRHSVGETLLAHAPRAWRQMQADARQIADKTQGYGVSPQLIGRDALRDHGLGGDWYGALTIPLGFALNPRKYHAGLAQAALRAGARLFAGSPATAVLPERAGWRVVTPTGGVLAGRVVVATNGYSSEDIPDWLRGRYLPAQSSVIVTRPLSEGEQAAQGWTSAQMAYDSRRLLHYFRLMPDGRFLFGMRGGLRATPRAQAAISHKIRADFARLFPAWADVEITHEWSGLVCLMPELRPFVGPVPDHPGLFAALGYHGNGVAMGSHAGKLVAATVLGRNDVPAVMAAPPGRFPLGRFRRALLRPAYWLAEAFDL
ncbi:FAD-binding oxidoreductase [Thalassococcus sp. CAU 1522]|uniref:FAD-binding oxidoreductase n=1 Tax=Thalassococcus arenae TaxID=2851652 RepID=A0ABS6N5W6_9RHOB|nr:FAD-dependent oxidoreductase [Thalassococcus arenae]MBV2359188.1 FAD-binding oxidoreductase [Thalassococcus arenae]